MKCIFQSVYMEDYIYRIIYVELSLYLWDEANLIMVDDLFGIFLTWFGSILLRNFASMFLRENGL